MCTVFPTNKITHAIHPNDINRSMRNPPKRSRRGGACVPARTSAQQRFHTKKYTHCVWGIERWMRPCRATRAGTQAPPLPISTNHTWCAIISSHCTFNSPRQTTRCVHTPPYCTFDSSKSHGVPLPHRGYTFDSAGLASATQPTLGNDVRDKATPLGVVLFLITHHYHMRRMDYSRMISPHEN